MEEKGLASMTGAAIAMHEWYLSLVKAGFTEAQALRLIAATMKTDKEE